MDLSAIIKNKIEKSGPIPFREFMSMALYHDDFGYYTKSSFPAGARGDFVTSPHTSRLFGALLCNQIEEFFKYTSSSDFQIVEMGAGAGYLAGDILKHANECSALSQIKYVIVEPHPETRAIQRSNLENLSSKVEWVEGLDNLEEFNGCLISNELLDSFPVHLVHKENDDWYEVYVDLDSQGAFVEILRPILDDDLNYYLATLPFQVPSPYRTEINLAAKNWIKQLSGVLKKGFVLTIDYGYSADNFFAPHRNRGTLLGYYSQNVVEDVLQSPGFIDITSHVNFTDLCRWGKENGLDPIGFAPQYAFLGGLDFEGTFRKIYKQVDPFSPEMAAVKMLILPQGMGESHQVFVQSKNINSSDIKLSGFNFVNRVNSICES